MKISTSYKVRKVATAFLVVCQGKVGADMTKVIELNATSVAIWKAFEGRDFTVADVAAFLVETYHIDQALADRDAAQWASSLRDCHVIAD